MLCAVCWWVSTVPISCLDVLCLMLGLSDVYEYPSEDIIILLESDELNDMQPTRDNIVCLILDSLTNQILMGCFVDSTDQEPCQRRQGERSFLFLL